MEKYLYVVLSQTGTFPSNLIKLFTRGQLNHASISLTPDLKELYSFGRVRLYNPFRGGLVRESPDFGTFKRFSHTRIAVIRIPVDDCTYELAEKTLLTMYAKRRQYKYNYKGLLHAIAKKPYKRENYFFCSEFVAYVLESCNVVERGYSDGLVTPMDLMKLACGTVVYRGEICDFADGAGKEVRRVDAEGMHAALPADQPT